MAGSHRETIKQEVSARVLEGDYWLSTDQGAMTLCAAKSITLQVGASKLVMSADGTLHLSGTVVNVDGSSSINLNK